MGYPAGAVNLTRGATVSAGPYVRYYRPDPIGLLTCSKLNHIYCKAKFSIEPSRRSGYFPTSIEAKALPWDLKMANI